MTIASKVVFIAVSSLGFDFFPQMNVLESGSMLVHAGMDYRASKVFAHLRSPLSSGLTHILLRIMRMLLSFLCGMRPALG